MPLSWTEIRQRAIAFSKEWIGAKRESAEKQTFWNEFFNVFGIRRRVVASFEEPVRKISGEYGYIDLFWPGMALVEHKSFGKSLSKAESQAFSYIQDLAREGRAEESPRYLIVSDFARIALHDLEPDNGEAGNPKGHRSSSFEFSLSEFHKHIHLFAFIPGYKQQKFEEQDPINIRAVEILGRLHDTLEAGGYSGHKLERFLVRILFCLFAEDTGIFERESFRLYLLNRTTEDGSDLGLHLARLFDVLNTPTEERPASLDESLAEFRYVNGDLFAENLGFADFNRDMRNALLACTSFDWSRISPAIFGSLFQAVMEPKERRQIGGHYTSERDILKVIRSLFLDELRDRFGRIKSNKAELRRFHQDIAKLRFLDPACGCGNFLVVTYRELRLLEIEILKQLYGEQGALDLKRPSLVDVDAFYGIEISEWPARIAEVAMWLMDHQMNNRLSEAFGQYYARLPLTKSPSITCRNALRLDWKEILPPSECSYILGNPPFVGKQFATACQKADMKIVCGRINGGGILDYVTAWYIKAAEYIQKTRILVAFVSTNSISQGEQVGILWNELFKRYHLKIRFAHRTFAWASEARGKAHVHVVIVGFSAHDADNKIIYDYEADSERAHATQVRNVSPYLIEGGDVVVLPRSSPVSPVPEIVFGNMPNDGGHLLLTDSEKEKLLNREPDAARFIRPFVGAQEFINGVRRWCLWLKDASPAEVRALPEVMKRVEAVKKHRLASPRETTRALAKVPTLFGEIRQPDEKYLLIPSVSSERRRYIPIGFMPKATIGSNLALLIPAATLYHFGVLSSAIHMAWVKQVCGRLESRYRYSNTLVYNNFPWPPKPTPRQVAIVEAAACVVLETRDKFPNTTLADLYDPLTMPPILAKAHSELDRAVDLCYRPQRFENDRQRIEYLFALYEKLTAPLAFPSKKDRKKARSR